MRLESTLEFPELVLNLWIWGKIPSNQRNWQCSGSSYSPYYLIRCVGGSQPQGSSVRTFWIEFGGAPRPNATSEKRDEICSHTVAITHHSFRIPLTFWTSSCSNWKPLRTNRKIYTYWRMRWSQARQLQCQCIFSGFQSWSAMRWGLLGLIVLTCEQWSEYNYHILFCKQPFIGSAFAVNQVISTVLYTILVFWF